MKFSAIGKAALLIAMSEPSELEDSIELAALAGFEVAVGRVGSMEVPKVIAAIETAAKREGIIDDSYREQHALYHAIIDAFQGLGRGPLELGNVLRTVGLRFAIVKGSRVSEAEDGLWLAVAMYGLIGAPIRGHEHEVCGLGINHL